MPPIPEKRKLTINSISLLANRLTQGVATFVITAAIARTLGAEALGQYLLAINYYYIFVNLASQGFKTLFTRELARNPEITPVYLVSGTLLQLGFGLIGSTAMMLLIFVLPYSAETSFVGYVTAVMIVPFALSNVTEAIFQAQEKMHLIAFSTVPIYILRLFAIIWAVQAQYTLPIVIGILIVSETLILIIQWLLLIRLIKPAWQIDRDFIWNTIGTAWTFFAMEGIGIIASRIDILILSLLGSEALVGIYGAICQLLQPYYIVSSSIALAAFPGMSKAVSLGKEKQQQTAGGNIELLLSISLPFLVGLFFVGDRLLLFIYQDPSFAKETMILHIISLSLLTGATPRIFSYLLIANGLEKLHLIEVAITTIVGSLAGIILVYQFQLTGAALMNLAIWFTNFVVMAYFIYDRLFSFKIWPIIRKPLLISASMSIVFLILNQINLDFIPTIVVATLAYVGLFGLVIVRKQDEVPSA
jgi:O-antigen/teichoic acid export membrane protein